AGSYPNFFFDVRADELDAFVSACEQISSQADYQRLEARFGVSRKSQQFWPLFDWFQSLHSRNQPGEGGVLDVSRYSVINMQED
ncbi:MAG: fatty acid cis/trans isomerase, partial [Mariprofundaceae bacterium]|nr:fatty acid cis/trans isomerase [Mariprofundaceae bacterium]